MLNLSRPLKDINIIRGFAAHVAANPGTWYGVDYRALTPLDYFAVDDGYVSHTQKINTGGGWNFRLNLQKYPGWFAWYAHCSSIPTDGQIFKRSQAIGKTGATGTVSGPHLHLSLLQNFIPRDPENPTIAYWNSVQGGGGTMPTDLYKVCNALMNFLQGRNATADECGKAISTGDIVGYALANWSRPTIDLYGLCNTIMNVLQGRNATADECGAAINSGDIANYAKTHWVINNSDAQAKLDKIKLLLQ